MELRTAHEPASSALLVVIPSHDMRAVVPTLMALERVGHLLHRELQTVVGEGSNIPRARNVALQALREQWASAQDPWVLWLDSDIWLANDSILAVAEAIRWTEAYDTAVVANYRMSDGRNVLMKRRAPEFPVPGEDAHYTDAHLGIIGLRRGGHGRARLCVPQATVDLSVSCGRTRGRHLFLAGASRDTFASCEADPLGHKKLVLLT
jgi:hypothetical protein